LVITTGFQRIEHRVAKQFPPFPLGHIIGRGGCQPGSALKAAGVAVAGTR
jgi:hypothetical protein